MQNQGRKPWLAALLSFLSPGLGQYYCGRPKRALALLFVPLVGLGVVFSAALLNAPKVVPPLFGVGAVLLLILYVAIPLDAYLEARSKREQFTLGPRNRWYEYLGFALLGIAVNRGAIWWYRGHLLEPFVTPSGSMMPTLIPGDRLYVDKRFRSEIERGELVVVRSPEDPKVLYLKRVIGKAGDRIEMDGQSLKINDTELPRERADTDPELVPRASGAYREHLGTREYLVSYADSPPARMPKVSVVVLEGQLFVLGDNRDNSFDSRYWGAVASTSVVGRPLQVWLSIDPDRHAVRWKRVGLLLR